METFLTNQDGTLPADPRSVPAQDTAQFAKAAVDRATRAVLIKSPEGLPVKVQVQPPTSTTTASTDDSITKAVADAGTPERLYGSPGAKLASQILLVPRRANTGIVYAGFTADNDSQDIELPAVLAAPDGKKLDAYSIYLDVTVNGEGVRAILID